MQKRDRQREFISKLMLVCLLLQVSLYIPHIRTVHGLKALIIILKLKYDVSSQIICKETLPVQIVPKLGV